MTYHPVQNEFVRSQYIKQGEIKFVLQHEELGRIALKKDRNNFVSRMLRRFSNAFVYTRNSSDLVAGSFAGISDETLALLEKHSLLKNGYWLVPELSESEIQDRLQQFSIGEQEQVVLSWSTAKQQLESYNSSIHTKARALLMSLFPFIALLIGLTFKSIRRSPVFLIAVAVYLVYLSPYVAVSHYMRYQYPLAALQIVFFLYLLKPFIEKNISSPKDSGTAEYQ